MTPEIRTRWMASRTKHGGYSGGKESPEHYVWRSMLARCGNPNDKSYRHYGGRGIKVDERWLDYAAFINDMGCRPSADHSLDRIDTNWHYTPANCRWATRSEQQRNKTTTVVYSDGAFTGCLTECAEYIGVTKNTAFERWKAWGTFEKGKKWQKLQRDL